MSMKIIISPAKKMQIRNDDMPWRETPVFCREAEELLKLLQSFSEEELGELFKANAAINP